MQIILREDIPSLGKAGEVVKVSEGYGRNFLLPRKKAMIATEGNLKRLEQDKQIIEAKRAIEREVGSPVRHFAYCNGWYSDEVIRTLKLHGFRSGVTTEDVPNRIGGDPFSLKRKVLWENFSIGMLGDYSTALTGCQLDDCFGLLGMSQPVPGRRAHLSATQAANRLLLWSRRPREELT